MATLTVDTHELRQLSQALEGLSRKHAGIAVRNGLNNIAFAARDQWQTQMGATLILRNDWARKAVRVDKVTTWNIGQMRSVTGSVWRKDPGKPHSSSMEEVEEGETESKKSGAKHGLAVPMGAAAGQSNIPTTRLVLGGRRLKKIRLGNRPNKRFSSPEQELAVSLRMARQSSSRYAFLDLGKVKGVFYVPKKVFKNRQDRDAGEKQRGKMIWSYSRASVRMKPHPTLEPVVHRVPQTMPKYIVESIEKQTRIAFAAAGLRGR